MCSFGGGRGGGGGSTQTDIVRLKQNAGNWRWPLRSKNETYAVRDELRGVFEGGSYFFDVSADRWELIKRGSYSRGSYSRGELIKMEVIQGGS